MSTIITITLPPTPAQVEALTRAGRGATVHHPRARTKAGRNEIARALGKAKLAAPIIRSLGYSSEGVPAPEQPRPAAKGQPAVEAKVEPAKPDASRRQRERSADAAG
jgi:Holliday junction resolvase RusA-like endonuclease